MFTRMKREYNHRILISTHHFLEVLVVSHVFSEAHMCSVFQNDKSTTTNIAPHQMFSSIFSDGESRPCWVFQNDKGILLSTHHFLEVLVVAHVFSEVPPGLALQGVQSVVGHLEDPATVHQTATAPQLPVRLQETPVNVVHALTAKYALINKKPHKSVDACRAACGKSAGICGNLQPANLSETSDFPEIFFHRTLRNCPALGTFESPTKKLSFGKYPTTQVWKRYHWKDDAEMCPTTPGAEKSNLPLPVLRSISLSGLLILWHECDFWPFWFSSMDSGLNLADQRVARGVSHSNVWVSPSRKMALSWAEISEKPGNVSDILVLSQRDNSRTEEKVLTLHKSEMRELLNIQSSLMSSFSRTSCKNKCAYHRRCREVMLMHNSKNITP